jgi:4-hydroxy-4-methyl-2-oxoglutarate aldolase
VPVSVGGITVNPGDLLHADRNGVTTIPPEIASEIAPACAEFFRAEAVILDYLQSEQVTVKGLTEACGECDRMIAKLTEQITSR